MLENYFSRVFSEILDKIEDQDIREKTVRAWIMAAEEGGWDDPEQIDNIPFSLAVNCHEITLIEHCIAVAKGAEGLAKAASGTYDLPYSIEYDFLYAGGLLHDIGKLLEYEIIDGGYQKSFSGQCARHPISGAIIVSKAGLPLEIINIVACHAREGKDMPKRIETILITHADKATYDPLVMLNDGSLII